jgi:hypothetical protein
LTRLKGFITFVETLNLNAMKQQNTLEVKLVHTTDKQRFYKLNRIIDKFPRQIDLDKEIYTTVDAENIGIKLVADI